MISDKKLWILPLSVISLIFGLYNLGEDLKHQENLSEKLNDMFEERQTKTHSNNSKFDGLWHQKKALGLPKVVEIKDFVRENEIISSEVKAEQESILAQVDLLHSMHAKVSDHYVQARVYTFLKRF